MSQLSDWKGKEKFSFTSEEEEKISEEWYVKLLCLHSDLQEYVQLTAGACLFKLHIQEPLFSTKATIIVITFTSVWETSLISCNTVMLR